MQTPGELSGFYPPSGVTPGPVASVPGSEANQTPDGNACELQVIENQGEGEPDCQDAGNKGENVYNIQSVYTSAETPEAPIAYNPPAFPGIDRSQIPVLQETEVNRHDEQVARLCRDSLEAFQKGKTKGPGGRKVIPIQKVSDLTALDTLFRRATRQGERTGGEASRPILNIQFLGGVSRESVRVAEDETSRIIDVAGEEEKT
jgi:hypothetical protein